MNMTRTFALLAGLAAAGLPPAGQAQTASPAQTAAPSPKLQLGPCSLPGLPPDARCGTFEVFENRAARAGRKIPLRVAVIPALGPDRLSDPVVYFSGGPGTSSVEGGGFIARELAPLRQRRDILLVDFRGTGGSGGLFCTELQGSRSIQGYLDDFLPAAAVRKCAERLARQVDLSQYTTDATVDDVDDVRAALGYDKLNLFGVSAGSRAALIYLRRHPERVRTLTLWGVVPPDELGPFSMAKSVQQALDGLLAECEGDPACRGAFPNLRAEVSAVLERAAREPVAVRLIDPETAQPQEIRLSRNGVAQTLRYMLYGPSTAADLPLAVHLAAQGDWKPLAESARFFGTNLVAMSDGYYLALTCAEDLPFLREEEIPAAVQGTFLGDFRIRKQQEACAAWPAPRVGREFLAPVSSDVPTLMITGERDPVTPPGNGERAARTLRNSRHLVMPDGGHGFEGITGAECADRLIVALVESGSVEGLEVASCAAAARRPEFVLSRAPEIQLAAADLARLTGTYADRESGMEVRIDVLGSYLRATFGSEVTVLVPTSPTRFRLEGLPPGYAVVFQLADGRPTAAVLEEPGGREPRTLARQP